MNYKAVSPSEWHPQPLRIIVMEFQDRTSPAEGSDDFLKITGALSGDVHDGAAPAILREWTARDFSTIYIRYRPTLVLQAGRILKDQYRAEEVVQDAFLYLLTALPELDSEVGVLRFLRWKTRMLCIDLVRSERDSITLDFQDGLDFADIANEPVDELTRADDEAVVNMALAKLNSRHRQVLIAKVYEEKSNAQLASELGISENALRQVIHRARQAFKRALVGEAELEGKRISEILSIASRRFSGAPVGRVSSAAVLVFGLTYGLAFFSPNDGLETMQFSQQRNAIVDLSDQPTLNDSDVPEVPAYGVEDNPENIPVQRNPAVTPSFSGPDLNETSSAEEMPVESALPIQSESMSSPLASTEAGLAAVLNSTLARSLEASSTTLTTELSSKSLSMKSDSGFSAHISYDLDSEFVIQHLSLAYDFESELGPVRLVAAPLNSLEVPSFSEDGSFVVDYVASDWLFGDLDGVFANETSSNSSLSRSAVAIRLEFSESYELIDHSLKVIPRL